MYKLIDLQGAGLRDGIIYKSKEEIYHDLKSYHGQDNDTTNWTLEDCLEIGQWEIVEAPLKATDGEWDKHN